MALLATSLLWSAARVDRLHRARLAAAEALRRSEERYRTLVEGQPDPICQFLPDTTLTFVNRAYADFYGREPEELIGKRWLDFAARDERPRFLEELTSFTPEHPERHEETRSTRADHEVRWYLCHLYGFFDDAGKIVSFQTFGTDITARKRAEELSAKASGGRALNSMNWRRSIARRRSPRSLRSRPELRAPQQRARGHQRSSRSRTISTVTSGTWPLLREASTRTSARSWRPARPVAFEVSGETPKAPGVQRDWVAASITRSRSRDGSVVAVGAIVQEITERKRSERRCARAKLAIAPPAKPSVTACGCAIPRVAWSL